MLCESKGNEVKITKKQQAWLRC